MAILTISQEMGSGGAEIGMAVANRLGYTYVDQEELLGRAKRYGLAEDRLARLAEDRPSWVERFDAETRRCILALQVVLYEFAQDDNVVLMGGGGQWLLRGVPHVLRTRIVAPFPVRVTRLTATLSAQGKERVTPKTVAQFIRRDDIQKAARMRYLFDAEVKDPSLYDLLINTSWRRRGDPSSPPPTRPGSWSPIAWWPPRSRSRSPGTRRCGATGSTWSA
jgi:cytidylate kinase